ncbi:MAG: metalloregulator ArsR/SmtB family transcription factor [Leptolyngbyaceae cyanobacterium bins.349]|nr:metalloregulator ArsR/SmtB family transcription factor [Leptolyngbyaceae cyanobacterium bins.349]
MPKAKPMPIQSAPVGPSIQPSEEDALNCTVQHPVDLSHVRQLHKELLSQEKSQRMAEFFSLLGDPNRLRILSALAADELCVCDLAAVVRMTESAVSHQLRTLRSMRLVGYRRQGRNVFYYLKDSHVLNLYREVAEHLDEPEES